MIHYLYAHPMVFIVVGGVTGCLLGCICVIGALIILDRRFYGK